MKMLIENNIYSVPPELIYFKDPIPKDIKDSFIAGSIKALKKLGIEGDEKVGAYYINKNINDPTIKFIFIDETFFNNY